MAPVLWEAWWVQEIHCLFMTKTTTVGGNEGLHVLLEKKNMMVGAKAWWQMQQENSSALVRAQGLNVLSVSAHTQTSWPKAQPILKLTECEDVKSNIISVLIINQGTITGFASVHLLVFVCLYLHSKTSCCIKYEHNDVHMLMHKCFVRSWLGCSLPGGFICAAGSRGVRAWHLLYHSAFNLLSCQLRQLRD